MDARVRAHLENQRLLRGQFMHSILIMSQGLTTIRDMQTDILMTADPKVPVFLVAEAYQRVTDSVSRHCNTFTSPAITMSRELPRARF